MPNDGVTARTLGETLRTARESRGLSLERLATSLRIRKRYLEAIEDDRFTDLPPRPYCDIFVTSFAKEVGISPREALDRYFAETGEAPPKIVRLWDVADEETPVERESRPLLWVAIAIVVVALVAVLILSRT